MNNGDSYAPLASYGPEMNLVCRETLFDSQISDESVMDACKREATYVAQVPGFLALGLFNDGDTLRIISYWRHIENVENFDTFHRPVLMQRHEQAALNNPWGNHLTDRRIGRAGPHLIGPQMPAGRDNTIVISPAPVFLVKDISGINDVEELQDLCLDLAPASAASPLLSLPGFLLYSAVYRDDATLSLYAAFRTSDDAARFLESDTHRQSEATFANLRDQQGFSVENHTGRLLAWYLREIT